MEHKIILIGAGGFDEAKKRLIGTLALLSHINTLGPVIIVADQSAKSTEFTGLTKSLKYINPYPAYTPGTINVQPIISESKNYINGKKLPKKRKR